MAFIDEFVKKGLKFKMEGLEDVDKLPKLFMIHVQRKEQPMEKVEGTKI